MKPSAKIFNGFSGIMISLLAMSLTAHAKTDQANTPDQSQQACGLKKEQIAEMLTQADYQKKVSKLLNSCLPNTMEVPAQNFDQVKFNTSYEGLTGCGYHPQAKSFHCSLDIKRRWGYGSYNTNPPQASGSFEWVTLCVDNGSGFQKVGVSGVHLANEHRGEKPVWSFGIEVPVEQEMYGAVWDLGRPLDQKTLKARAILSWAAPVNACNKVPVWGNILDFRIRRDS